MDKHTYRQLEVAEKAPSLTKDLATVVMFLMILGFWVCAITGFIFILKSLWS